MPIAMTPSPPPSDRARILFLGDDIKYDPTLYQRLTSQFDIVHPPPADLQRPAFLQHLRDGSWGRFQAIMRPSWHTGGEMGNWDEELIQLLPPGLKVYASAGAGYDWVDVFCLAKHGILYCNGAGASTEAVGDMALWHIISVFRNMTSSFLAARSMDSKRFSRAHHDLPATSYNPRGHTLGIVGLGNIGYAIALKAYAAFGMKILYHDIVRKRPEQEDVVQAEFHPDVGSMLRKTDCLLLATPSTLGGRPFLTSEVIAQLPRGSRFVNIARGSLVDEDALADALESGHLAAAGLDVHASEPHVNKRMVNMLNVTMTCHTGGGAVETKTGFEQLAMENVERVLNGMEALTPVNGHLIKESRMNGHANGHDTNGERNGAL
ncbi:MAG: hypothetical protein L6R38_000083 [Xanthoria sp. 2 TBL-2021]|nr:MAG: hypothetical protein L6R38_000083 [Xanthoria sp. 2 TBL-2021]